MAVRFAVVLCALLASPTTAWAQGTSATAPRFWLDMNIGRAMSAAEETTFPFDFVIFAEPASISATYPKPSTGGALDFGAGYFFMPRVGAGVSLSRASHSDLAGLGATIPHPLHFNAHASATGETSRELSRKETAFNVQLMAIVLERDAVQVRVFGGPSFIRYQGDLVRDMSIDQVAGLAPAENMLTITGHTDEQTSGRTTGFHAGGDVTYFFTPNVGVGGGVRLSRGTVTLDREPMSEVSQDIKVGGTQAFFGLHFRFGGR